ncbi:hypothetical protein, partial [Lysinibacillus capsici]|uniref:hypothetical protein n=1 Tax=Lysinibacillus capsici TaxID=2115968 RepID=UPI002A810E03
RFTHCVRSRVSSVTLNPLGVTLAPLQSTILQKCLCFIFHTGGSEQNNPLFVILEGMSSYFQCEEVMRDNTSS